MAVTIEKIDKAFQEINRFIVKAQAAKKRLAHQPGMRGGCRETGAVRRASMDLSRALVEIRR